MPLLLLLRQYWFEVEVLQRRGGGDGRRREDVDVSTQTERAPSAPQSERLCGRGGARVLLNC